ncbi:hypothetical protein LCGC14_0672470 [marine sediment metagenome]|uniref:Uncharacterized protein n=1 Tax=marine sediment metagenome TaxID=412755 RepID=A0A0F9RAU2_9ZZZZ
MNVRPIGQLESRERGGSRPGLLRSHIDSLGSAVRFLHPMVLAPGTGLTSWSDTFGGTSMADIWSTASWASNGMSILTQMASVDTSVSDGAVVRDTVSPAITASTVYTVEMMIVPWNGAFHGKYRMYLRMDDTTPLYTTDGLFIELTMTGTSGGYAGDLISYLSSSGTTTALTAGTIVGGATRAVWLIAQVTNDNVVVYLDGVEILSSTAVDAQSGLRVGFGLETTEAGGVNLVNAFRIQYTSAGTVTPLRSTLIGSAGGNIWKEPRYGRMTVTSSSLTLRNDVPLGTAQSGQKLYIADYGDLRATATDGTITGTALDSPTYTDWTTLGILTDDDVCVLSGVGGSTVAGTYKISSVASGTVTLASSPGNGTATFRIERAPKIYDPAADTLSILTATDGAGGSPTGCPLVARYLDRLVLAGAEISPGIWYMARVGDELDWDYSQTDSKRAVAGPASDAGIPARAITALAPHSDDYLIIACRESLWRMRGDPAFGGSLDNLSSNIGIIGMHAWTYGPEGEMIFLSLDGLYVLAPGADSTPISLSREVLPREMLNFDPDNTIVNLEYDVQDRGIHIFLTETSTNARTHWWMNWERKTFWPLQMTGDHEPTATCNLQATAIEDSGIICGGRDGILRRFSFLSEDDIGNTPASYIFIGPIALAKDGQFGTIVSIDAEIAENVGDVTWAVHPGNTFEAATSASSVATGTWVAGLNGTVRPGGRGQAFMLKLTGTSGRRWSMEQIIVNMRDSGKRRIA